jgi:hypothetical protein
MSTALVSRSSDLQRLRDEGFDIEIRSGHLLVKHVPYVNSEKEVKYGVLVSELSTSGDVATKPSDHTAAFVGGVPCDNLGTRLGKIINSDQSFDVIEGLTAACRFSSKPPEGYPDYYAKMTAYVRMVSDYANVIDSTVTAQTFPPVATTEDESVFRYADSASSRAGISAITSKLGLAKVAIVGLGGTGAYILDLIAKTPIQEIHLFDADRFLTHNAFRAPGAATLEELNASPTKVEYFQQKYDPLRRGIVAHSVEIDSTNMDELRDMSFVFLAMDSGPTERLIIKQLEEYGTPFIEVGMGVRRVGESLAGIVRVTASTPGNRDHVWERNLIPFDADLEDEYDKNVQIADLNALNAVLAVLKWKKMCNFYADQQRELSIMYTIDGNHLLNENQAL